MLMTPIWPNVRDSPSAMTSRAAPYEAPVKSCEITTSMESAFENGPVTPGAPRRQDVGPQGASWTRSTLRGVPPVVRLQERVRLDRPIRRRDRLDELVGLDLTDQVGLGDVVVVSIDGDPPFWGVEGDARRGVDDLVDVERASLLDHRLIEPQRRVGRLHRVRGDALLAELGLERLDERHIARGIDGLVIVPGRHLAGQVDRD